MGGVRPLCVDPAQAIALLSSSCLAEGNRIWPVIASGRRFTDNSGAVTMGSLSVITGPGLVHYLFKQRNKHVGIPALNIMR